MGAVLKIGPYNKLIILGGGPLLVDVYRWAVSMNVDLKVLTSSRLETIHVENNVTLKEYLQVNSIRYLSIDKTFTLIKLIKNLCVIN